MAIVTSAVVKVVAQLTDINGSQIENVFFWQNVSGNPIVQTSFMAAVEAKLSAMYAEIEGYLPDTLTPVNVTADVVSFVSGKVVNIQSVGDVPWTTWSGGTATGEGLPQGNAAVCSFPSISPGSVGRKYFGPLVEQAQADGVLNSTVQTALAALVTEFLTDILVGSDALTPVIMATKYSSPKELVSGIVNAVVGYQRRRKNGVGS